jgi:trehalose synthase
MVPERAAHTGPQEVSVPPLSPQRFETLLDEEAWQEFQRGIEQARHLLEGRVVWNVNSTAAGGGVAEMLRSFVSYSRGAGIDMRWSVIAGTADYFRITKRLHNFLHGYAGDGGDLGPDEAATYESVSSENAEQLAVVVGPQDIVILHDPQTAGLAPRLKAARRPLVVWRSHVGAEEPNELVQKAWEFLAPYLEAADARIFSRRAYVPSWAGGVRTEVIQPSIDAFSPKNQDMGAEAVQAILSHVGLVVGEASGSAPPTFTRSDGTPGRVDHLCEVLSTGPPPGFDTPLVVQVSRWDRLKDPIGVMHGFAEHVADRTPAHLILAGPTVNSVADDPEGAQILDETEAAWRDLPHARRSQVHLACLPMVDIEENAAIVNALQRQATIIVQKSIEEGFGLTVAEGMWKSRPVVASRVGGIQDQIEGGVTGILVEDPRDLGEFGEKVLGLLEDPERANKIGAKAREHVRRNFLVNRHSLQYIRLLASILQET